MAAIRCDGNWFKVTPNPYEPERQTYEIAWHRVREPLVLSPEAYRKWYTNEQRKVKVLYPSFRKDDS
jgi:hypothetical protein